ncbi:S-methyl-5'-thioadenosine phosphorylase [bacterium]|nr:S-methyl-5'-thioadenosine phosphorylase [bacterium]
MAKIGIIGGSGLYDMEGLENVEEIEVNTPFGKPSDKYITGTLSGKEVVFLPRHGRGHKLSPSEINYCANIYGMKKLGVEWIISVGAVGSLKADIHPLDIVIPDQFFDRTNQGRRCTFFGDGIVAHVSFANPVCLDLSRMLYEIGKGIGLTVHKGGTYLNMEGPAFSTKAESFFYRKMGFDVIGMTNLLEAKLAREAEICYGAMAMVTDYDCWHETEDDVSLELVLQYMNKNSENAKKIIKEVVKEIPSERKCECANALANAIITDRSIISQQAKDKLRIITGKYL